MRQNNRAIESYRVRTGPGASDMSFGNNGAFMVKYAGTQLLRVIASDGEGWDHVSVSLPHRCPMWEEMSFIKGLFFGPEECVIQFHPPQSEYVNCHPFCLHLWRSQSQEFPLPPSHLVGPKADRLESINEKVIGG